MKVMTAVAPNDTNTPIPAMSGSLSVGCPVTVQFTLEAQLPILKSQIYSFAPENYSKKTLKTT